MAADSSDEGFRRCPFSRGAPEKTGGLDDGGAGEGERNGDDDAG